MPQDSCRFDFRSRYPPRGATTQRRIAVDFPCKSVGGINSQQRGHQWSKIFLVGYHGILPHPKTYFIRYISGLLHAKSCKYGGHLCREGGVAEAVAEEA